MGSRPKEAATWQGRMIELNEEEAFFWDELSPKGSALRQFKRAIGRLIWQDCRQDVAVITPSGQILWYLKDEAAAIVMGMLFRGQQFLAQYEKRQPGQQWTGSPVIDRW